MPDPRLRMLKASFVMDSAPLVRSREALNASLVTPLVALMALDSSPSKLKEEL